jgi:type IV secretory pathway VirD2 relaxase
MSTASFNELFRGGALRRPGDAIPNLRPYRVMKLDDGLRDDELRGRVQGARAGAKGSAKLSHGLDQRLGLARRFGFRSAKAGERGMFDARQRVIVKLHFFGHGGGGAAALKAHVRYVARDGAQRDMAPEREPEREREKAERERAAEQRLRAHAGYLERERSGAREVFYDALEERVDGAARAAVWGREDRRHFRIILAAENGAQLKDLKPFVREVMDRAEAALGTRLEWVAVDHWDTDNPHTHVLLRGRRADGRPLILPRDFVKHGFRNAARDVATDRLGERTREDERLALQREARAHRPTRLDALIERQIEANGELRLGRIEAPGRDPALTNALKARARELQRLGLAVEARRNVLSLQRGWRDQLTAMELHLDVRKRLMLERSAAQRGPVKGPGLPGLLRGPER